MEMARSYINIHESRRTFENHLHSQRKKQQSDEARLQAYMLLNVFLNRRDQNKDRFPRNVFITSKYTPWNFLFINLFEQFSRVANFVFLLVTLVQLIPGVSPFNIWSTLLPLIFILLVTAIKEAWEDYLRHKADKITNNVMYKRILPDGSMQHVGSSIIAKQLDREGIPSPSGGRWAAYTVRDILSNPTYAGFVRWSWRPTVRKVVDGVLVETRPVNKAMALTDGLHPPIIPRDQWQRAQDIMASRAYLPMPGNRTIVNPLAGLVYCEQCGRSLVRLKGHRGNARDMLMCPNKDCTCKGSTLDEVENALLHSLERWLREYKLKVTPGKHPRKRANTAPLERALEAAQRERDTLVSQKGRLYDLLEQGVYTIDVFTQRQFELATRISNAEHAIQEAEQQLETERQIANLRLSIIPRVEHLLDVYHELETPLEKNEMLKTCLERVEYRKTVGGRYEKSDMELRLYPKISRI